MKIAVIGTGISGNTAAWLLSQNHDVHVFEQNDYIGGHSNTVSINGYPATDTGFIVYNEWTYPNLIALFDHLNVETCKTDMSFGVSLNQGVLEYSGDKIFAQKRNFLNPRFYQMLFDITRFYKKAPEILNNEKYHSLTLQEYLELENYSQAFIDHHLLPMAAAIWSTGKDTVSEFPAASFVRFFINHGLLLLKGRPQWRTVVGGSRSYVDKLTAPFKDKIRLNTKVKSIKRFDGHVEIDGEQFDHVIIASHSDQALSMLEDPSAEEKNILGAFPYAENVAFLHTDTKLMPQRKSVWSSWNYLTTSKNGNVCVTYWMNKLQPFIGNEQDLFVTLNPDQEPAPDKTLKKITYHHPQFKRSALRGWGDIHEVQGKKRTWFCGAWCGYGFHEDGLSSGLSVAEQVGNVKRPWTIEEKSPAGDNCKAS